ncbi:hypothetical protein LJB98_05380 [Bacteroidales bacterium OttesenSCG-928-M11]|nr:hypothetical protein [Bacteroidales bacterium OttesenSCG-928-M11]
MKKQGSIIILLLLLVSFSACKKEEDHRKYFEKHLETNIAACVDGILQGVEEVSDENKQLAEEVCLCMLESAYEHDSTVFSVNSAESMKVIEEHFGEMEIECADAIKELLESFPSATEEPIEIDSL